MLKMCAIYWNSWFFLAYGLLYLEHASFFGFTLAPWDYIEFNLLWAIFGILHNAWAMIVKSSRLHIGILGRLHVGIILASYLILLTRTFQLWAFIYHISYWFCQMKQGEEFKLDYFLKSPQFLFCFWYQTYGLTPSHVTIFFAHYCQMVWASIVWSLCAIIFLVS